MKIHIQPAMFDTNNPNHTMEGAFNTVLGKTRLPTLGVPVRSQCYARIALLRGVADLRDRGIVR